jgi:hypothetical protein
METPAAKESTQHVVDAPARPSPSADIHSEESSKLPASPSATHSHLQEVSIEPSHVVEVPPQPPSPPLAPQQKSPLIDMSTAQSPCSTLASVEKPSMNVEVAPIRSDSDDAPDISPHKHIVRNLVGCDHAVVETQDDLPSVSDATSICDALRIVVMTRLRCDRQTREERVNPVLMANLAIAEPPSVTKTPPVAELVSELSEGENIQASKDKFEAAKPSLLQRFAERKAALEEKNAQLREEYIELHGRWLEHCNRLDNSSRIDMQEETVAPSGRTTRRSTAMLGDTVRTDLEMEQLMAILGSEDHTDPNIISQRNLAIIPDMISVTHGHVEYLFDDTNNQVDDPSTFYAPNTGLHDWTAEEKEIFLKRFAAHPKQFGLIAEGLPNKTAAQCVDYYYLHKKTIIDFRKVMAKYAPGKRRGRKTDKYRGGGLLADIRQHDDEVLRHGNSSVSNGPTTRRRRTIISNSDPKKSTSSRLNASSLDHTPMSTPTPDPEPYVPQRGRRANTTRRIVPHDDGEEDGTASGFFLLLCLLTYTSCIL